jgi:hypothetical protein
MYFHYTLALAQMGQVNYSSLMNCGPGLLPLVSSQPNLSQKAALWRPQAQLPYLLWVVVGRCLLYSDIGEVNIWQRLVVKGHHEQEGQTLLHVAPWD